MGLMNRNSLGWCLALSAAGALGAGLAMAEPNKVPLVPLPAAAPAGHLTAPKALPTDHFAKPPARPILVRNVPLPRKRPHQGDLTAFAQANVALRGSLFATRAVFKPMARPVSGPFAIASTTATSPADIEQLKQVLEAARKGRDADADAAEKAIVDPVARKLAEWMILRSDNTNPTFQRYAAFVTANPAWPHVPLFRRRAENALWNDHADDATVLAFFAHKQPTTAKGRYVLAHALLAKGDRAGAAALVRHAWRQQDASADVENRVLEMFGDLLTRADHKVRMEQRLYQDDIEAGMRAAKRLGGNEIVLAKARAAVIKNLNNAKALLDDVPAAARQDAGYIFARAQWLRKNKKPDEAEKLILTAPQDPEALVDLNQWWLERRILVRQLLDENNPKAAYLRGAQGRAADARQLARRQIFHRRLDRACASCTTPRPRPNNSRISTTARPIRMRFRAAAIGRGARPRPWATARDAKAFYEMAAKYTATYYGQLARARLGLKDIGLVGPPSLTAEERTTLGNLEVVRAAELLYQLNERNMLASIFAEIGESGTDVAGMSMLAEVAGKHDDPRAMVLLGRFAHARGLPMDYYAYPSFGLPDYTPIAPPIDKAVTYSIVRQESDFDQQEVSSAHAMGLMQVTPEAGKDTARRFKVDV